MGTLRRICAKVREPSELRFGMVDGVGQGITSLDAVVQGGGDVLEFFPIFTVGIPMA